MLRLRCRLRAVRIFPVFCAEAQKSGACAPQEYEPSNHGVFRALLSQDKTKAIPFGMTFCFGGDKRDRTADLLNAIAPEVLDSVEVIKKVRHNRIKWTFLSPFRFNWYMVFCPVSGTYSGTKCSAKIRCSAGG